MSKWNPFVTTYDVKCPDGSVKTVYKKVEGAFPLFVAGWEANISGKMKSELNVNGELTGGYKTKVDGLLYGLDEINNGVMMSFRSAYVGYQSDPCTNNDFLLSQIEKVNDEQRRLRALKMQIFGYVEMIKNNTNNLKELAELYNDLVHRIGSSPEVGTAVVVGAIKSSTEAAKQLMRDI